MVERGTIIVGHSFTRALQLRLGGCDICGLADTQHDHPFDPKWYDDNSQREAPTMELNELISDTSGEMCMDCGHTRGEHEKGEGVERCKLCSCEAFNGTVPTNPAPSIVPDEIASVTPIHPTGGEVKVTHHPSGATLYPPPPVEQLQTWAEQSAAYVQQTENSVTQTRRSTILETADRIINGDRQSSYGDATESFERLAALWGATTGHPFTAEQVALCLIQLKISRLVNSPGHDDSWVDIAGYAALGGEIASTPGRHHK